MLGICCVTTCFLFTNGKHLDSRHKFQGRIYFEVFPVFSFLHPSLVNHFLGFLNVPDLFDVEHIPYDVPSNVFSVLRNVKTLGAMASLPFVSSLSIRTPLSILKPLWRQLMSFRINSSVIFPSFAGERLPTCFYTLPRLIG